MIEIICENETKDDEGQTTVKTGIRIPKNVKQIGEPPQGRRIYIEDYVYTYLTSLSSRTYRTTGYSAEFYGILLGEIKKSQQELCIFIRSAVRVKMPEENELPDYEKADEPVIPDSEIISFSQEVWTSLYDSVEKYFKGQEIVGWFLCADSHEIVADNENTSLVPWVQKLHFDNFAGASKAFFLVDCNAHEEYFYMVENGRLTRQGGFICFYERNEAMQEYMLAARPPRKVEDDVNDSAVQSFRTIIQEKKDEAVKHQSISIMYGICAFMIVVVTVIGINMMNSYEKMQTLDASMSKIANEIANMNVDSENFGQDSENTPVTKIDGNVYPTESEQETSSYGAEPANATLGSGASSAAGTGAMQETQQETQSAAAQTDAAVQASAAPQPTQAQTAAAPAYRTYVVEKGDTLISICKNVYGDGQRYKDVMELNKIDNPDKIFIGQEIMLPQ